MPIRIWRHVSEKNFRGESKSSNVVADLTDCVLGRFGELLELHTPDQGREAMTRPRKSSATAQAAGVSPNSQPSPEAVQLGVNVLYHGMTSAYLAASIGDDTLKSIPKASVMCFASGWLKNMQPRDNCEKSLLEMALISQFKAQQLMAEATTADVQRAEIYLKAAPKFLAEARKLFLAFRDYRSPPAAPQVNVVQQTITGDQQMAVVAAPAPANDTTARSATHLTTLIAETNDSVAAIEVAPRKSVDELIVESFMATPEVQEHLKGMDAAAKSARENAQSSRYGQVSPDEDEVCCVFGK